LLIVNYQQRFHVEPLLILDPINWEPPLARNHLAQFHFPRTLHRWTAKEATGAHAVAAGTSSSSLPPPCRDPFTAAAPVLGPLRHNHCGPFIAAAVGAPLTSPRHAASPPLCEWMPPPHAGLAYPAAIHHCPNISAFLGPGLARSP
jgi:hypothetical protein